MNHRAPFAVRIITGTFTVTLSVQIRTLKGKLIPVHAIDGIGGRGGIVPLILNHNTGKRVTASHPLQKAQYLSLLPGIETRFLVRPARSRVTTYTELQRLQHSHLE